MKAIRVLLIFIIFTAYTGCQYWGQKNVPDYLTGVWQTEEPRYKSRILELTKNRIIFGIGDMKLSVNIVRRVKRGRRKKNNLYTIYYRNPERQDLQFSFYYYPENNGAIRFKNQTQMEWKKVKHPLSWKAGG